MGSEPITLADLQPGDRFALVTYDRSHGWTYSPEYVWERTADVEDRMWDGLRLPSVRCTARFEVTPSPKRDGWFRLNDRVHPVATPDADTTVIPPPTP